MHLDANYLRLIIDRKDLDAAFYSDGNGVVGRDYWGFDIYKIKNLLNGTTDMPLMVSGFTYQGGDFMGIPAVASKGVFLIAAVYRSKDKGTSDSISIDLKLILAKDAQNARDQVVAMLCKLVGSSNKEDLENYDILVRPF